MSTRLPAKHWTTAMEPSGHGAVGSVLETRIYLVRTTPSAASRMGLVAVARASVTSWS